jgi:hypothetical protein
MANSWQQPVAGEPSLGTDHEHYAIIWSTVPPNNNVQVLSLAAYVPAGTKTVEGRWYMSANAANKEGYIYNVAGTNVYDALTTQVANQRVTGHFKAPLDSSLNIRYGVSDATNTAMFVMIISWHTI